MAAAVHLQLCHIQTLLQLRLVFLHLHARHNMFRASVRVLSLAH